MSCDDVRPRLTSYLDGDLDPDRGTFVRGHLRTCEGCRKISEDEAALRDGLRALPTVDPPSTLWANVQARLAASEVAESKRPAWRRALERWMPAPGKLAIGFAFAAAATGFVVWKVTSTHDAAQPEQLASAEPGQLPRVTEHPSPIIEASGSSANVPGPQNAPDATADLLEEPARITASYETTAKELLVAAKDVRPGWSDAAKAAFDAKVAGFQADVTRGIDERARQKTYRAMIRYVQNAVVRDEVMIARVP